MGRAICLNKNNHPSGWPRHVRCTLPTDSTEVSVWFWWYMFQNLKDICLCMEHWVLSNRLSSFKHRSFMSVGNRMILLKLQFLWLTTSLADTHYSVKKEDFARTIFCSIVWKTQSEITKFRRFLQWHKPDLLVSRNCSSVLNNVKNALRWVQPSGLTHLLFKNTKPRVLTLLFIFSAYCMMFLNLKVKWSSG